jgi:hypothetical protein
LNITDILMRCSPIVHAHKDGWSPEGDSLVHDDSAVGPVIKDVPLYLIIAKEVESYVLAAPVANPPP